MWSALRISIEKIVVVHGNVQRIFAEQLQMFQAAAPQRMDIDNSPNQIAVQVAAFTITRYARICIHPDQAVAAIESHGFYRSDAGLPSINL